MTLRFSPEVAERLRQGGGGSNTSDLIIDAHPSERPALDHPPHRNPDARKRGVSKPGVTRSKGRSQKRRRA
jgi:hypothetical protein